MPVFTIFTDMLARDRFLHLLMAPAMIFFGLGCAASQAASPTDPAYIGSDSCKDCHQKEFELWEQSHHADAWTKPTPETVLGDFSDTQFTHNGISTHFTQQGGQFFIETDGPNGSITKYPVAGVAGITPLQQYLIETAPGRLQSFDVVWDTENKRWYHLYPEQDLPFSDGLHWSGPYKNWNARCAECHATGYEKNFDASTKTYTSTQAEIGVGCEACHGPGEAHQSWAIANGTLDPERWSNLSPAGFYLDFKSGTEAEIQQCAGCHSRREPFQDGNPLPGTPFHDTYRLSTLRPGLYHPDGQILDEVYVYGSFLQSKMYAKGVACNNCHDPHLAQTVATGNPVCTQCHSTAGNPDFPSLPIAEYDDPSHHFHPKGSEGAQCKGCHMIERNYMGVDGRRDHSFRVPRPDLSIETRSPNACNDCHSDETATWAAKVLEDWYPDSQHRTPHFSQVFSPARSNPGAHAPDLMDIVEHAELPAIVRASALDLLAQASNPQIADRMEPVLSDPDPLVRTAAIPVQLGASPQDVVTRIAPLLKDPTQTVRIAAARAFLGLPIVRMPDEMTASLNQSMTEWQTSLLTKTDFPETQLVLAGIGLTTRRMKSALSAFQQAVDMDPQMVQAWTMMVRIHDALGDREAALETVNAAIASNPKDVSLGLLRADLLQ